MFSVLKICFKKSAIQTKHAKLSMEDSDCGVKEGKQLSCANWQMAAVVCEVCPPVAALCFRCVTRQGS